MSKPPERYYVLDSVADKVLIESEPPFDLEDTEGVQEFTLGSLTVQFLDQDGSGHYLGVVFGQNERHAALVAKEFLRVLTASGRM